MKVTVHINIKAVTNVTDVVCNKCGSLYDKCCKWIKILNLRIFSLNVYP